MKIEGIIASMEACTSKKGKAYQTITVDTGKEHVKVFNWGKRIEAAEIKQNDYATLDVTDGEWPRLNKLEIKDRPKEFKQAELPVQEQAKSNGVNPANSPVYLTMKLATEILPWDTKPELVKKTWLDLFEMVKTKFEEFGMF